jgi:hypothetical protein
MGAYVYRIKGTKAWSYQTINGTPEKVYDLVYWYKPYYHGMFESEPKWMKPIKMLGARLEKKFKEIGYPKYVRHFHEEGDTYSDVITEWGNTTSCSDEGQWYQSRKQYKWETQLNGFCSEEYITEKMGANLTLC